MVVQIIAGICAGAVYMATTGSVFFLGPQGSYNWGQVAAAEIIFTFVLCFVVLSVATTTGPCHSKDMFGIAIASCVTVGGNAIGAISGGSLNPAVSFGLDTANAWINGAWNCLLYSLYEFIGAGLA